MKKTLFLLIAVLLLSLALAGAAMAVTPAGTYIKWSQPIDRISGATHEGQPVYNGWDQPASGEYFAAPPRVYDDWECKDNRPVTDIHWWGSYLNWMGQSTPSRAPYGFWFTWYTDVPASSSNPYSHPGDMIKSSIIQQFQEVFVGYDRDPRTGQITDSTFQYNVALPESDWFRQDPSTNSIYWLSIEAVYWFPPSFSEWGWKTRPHFFQDDAVTIDGGGWDRVGYLKGDNFESWDMSFELSTVPEPSSLLALAVGLPALAGLATRKRYRA